ncbi:MAG: carbamoyltransferase [Planctomycetota bacterium]|nr:carbamoyltransferase [Planctomycetota bacterium]
MTAILGLSAFYHDSAAALVVDGRIVAAAQEERFTRKKHDAAFPARAIEYCLAEAGIEPGQLDYVGFYDKPLLKFDRLLETYLAYAPRGFVSFAKAMPVWLRRKLHLPRIIRRGLGGRFGKRCVFAEHHESHAASAFFPSPFDRAAILTLDGVGEWATASLGVGEGNRIRVTHELHFPHSLGLLYSAFTYYGGFRVNSGEYKLMGLAPYGEPVYADAIRKHLIDLKDDGSFRMAMRYFNYCQGLTMTSGRFHRLFGGPARKPESPLTQRHMDLAASIQVVTEEIVLRAVRHVGVAGGVGLNCGANGRMLREGPFERLWIQPAAGDAGAALGVAMLIWHQLLGHDRTPSPGDSQSGSLLGPAYDAPDIRAQLDAAGAVYEYVAEEETLCRRVAGLLNDGHVVGWMQGRMEWRSILGDPRCPDMQTRMNVKIKFRESFRPFAPSVLAESAADVFDFPRGAESPYMLLTAPVSAARRLAPTDADRAARGLDRLRGLRSDLPAITHVDYSARLQTVDQARHGRYWKLMKQFQALTGCPVLINTSFNVRGEPIVCTPADAYRCFMGTDMDSLVIENFLLRKADQPAAPPRQGLEHLAQFQPD